MPRAVLNGVVVAEADQTVVVEGNHYFPPDSVHWDRLTPSKSKTLCPWKGIAGYHHADLDGSRIPDIAWHYAHPSPLARRIKGHVAFGRPVRVERTDHDIDRPGLLQRLGRRQHP